MNRFNRIFCALFLVALPILSFSQIPSSLKIPLNSQRAEVIQRIGFTDIHVVYHSPAVRGRKIWGSNIAPYNGKPFLWRAGANENTTISFTDDVIIEGKALKAGIYGLHMMPTEDKFTIIFSNNSTSWGSFFYDESEDALRIEVTPQESPFREWLTYDFEVRATDHLILALKWENIKIPMKIELDSETTLNHIRAQLRSSPAFTSDGFKNAANYCLRNDINLEEGLTWINRALRNDKSFSNYNIKVGLQEKLGQEAEAIETLKASFAEASPDVLMNYVNAQLRRKEEDKAKMAVEYLDSKHAKTWQRHMTNAIMSNHHEDSKSAIKHLEKAHKLAPDNRKERISKQIDQLKAKTN